MRSASRLTDTGSATRAPGRASATSVSSASSVCSVPSAWPASSTTVPVSPSGSMTMPEVARRRAHELADALEPLGSRSSTLPRAAVAANGFTASTSAPIFASTAGMTSDDAPNE